MTETIDSPSSRFCRLCTAVAVTIALVAVVLLIVILNPPDPPPDYASIPLVTDYDWDAVQGQGGWNYSKRTATNDATIAQQTPTPASPMNVLAIDFTGVKQDSEPTVHYHALPGAREVYAEWWIKFSPNWTCSPAGCGKVSFFFPSMGGDLYMGIYCDNTSGGSCTETMPSHFVVGGQLQWPPYGGTPILANKTRTPIVRDRWYQMAHYAKWSSTPTAHDGIWRLYVDRVLNLELTDVAFDIGPAIEFQFAMSRQMPPPPKEFAWIDHTIVRGR